jgi:hypothetical protein
MGEPLSLQKQARHVFAVPLRLEGSFAIHNTFRLRIHAQSKPPTNDIATDIKSPSAGPPSQTESHFQTNKIAKLSKPQTVN